MKVGERIREIRKSQKLSQKQLGDRLGVSQAMIAQYENGDRNPKFETLLKIADALGVYIGKLDETWGTDLSNPAEYEKFKAKIESFETDLARKIEDERKQKIPGEIILNITQENFDKYKNVFLLAFDKIIEDIIEKTDFEARYFDAATGEEIFFSEKPNFRELTDDRKFIFLHETVKEIRFNSILNTFSITYI